MFALTNALGRRAAGLRGTSAGHESCHAFHFVIAQKPIPRHEEIHAPIRFFVSRIIVDTNILTGLTPTRTGNLVLEDEPTAASHAHRDPVGPGADLVV